MAKKQGRRYEETYKREAVRFLEETGKPVRTVAEELQVSESALARWRRQYGTGEAAGEALTPPLASGAVAGIARAVAIPEHEQTVFDCSRTEPRHPRETKGADYKLNKAASESCC